MSRSTWINPPEDPEYEADCEQLEAEARRWKTALQKLLCTPQVRELKAFCADVEDLYRQAYDLNCQEELCFFRNLRDLWQLLDDLELDCEGS